MVVPGGLKHLMSEEPLYTLQHATYALPSIFQTPDFKSHRGTSLIRKHPPPQDHHRALGPVPTVGSYEAAVSHERGTPVGCVSYERGTPVGCVSYERGTPVTQGKTKGGCGHRRQWRLGSGMRSCAASSTVRISHRTY